MNTTRIAGKPVARIAGATALTIAALLGTSACSLAAPVATMIQYDPADGFGADLGAVKIRDAQAIIGESGAVNLYFYVINSGTEPVRLNVASGAAGADGTTSLTLPPGVASPIGGPDDSASIVIERPTDALLGGLYPVYFQAGDADGIQLDIPVLDAEVRPFFEQHVP